MKQQELIEILTQLNTLDLKGEQKTEMTAKVLQMAADSVTLETLKSLLVSDKSKQTATPVFEEAVRPLGRKSKLGFTLTKNQRKHDFHDLQAAIPETPSARTKVQFYYKSKRIGLQFGSGYALGGTFF